MSPLYELRSAGLRYGSYEAMKNVSVAFDARQFVTIAGPNGAGKSTMLSVMAGLQSHYSGECLFSGRDVRRWNRSEFARRVSVVPQSVQIEFPFTAEQVVLMGRTPHAAAMFESDEDAEQVRRAMELTGTLDFRARDFRSLSGGEKQRVVVASALAQSPEALLLDEPTTHLDIEHQVSLYRLLRALAAEGMLVVAITHDLNLASSFADRIVVLRSGELVSDGRPESVFNETTMRDVFRVDAQIHSGPGGRPWIHYGQ